MIPSYSSTFFLFPPPVLELSSTLAPCTAHRRCFSYLRPPLATVRAAAESRRRRRRVRELERHPVHPSVGRIRHWNPPSLVRR
uniref:Uncharacterized protein n=1 Tax=Oryza sativa subsp. japonica TaxID=39947 RepID=Q6YWM9_ORYSJ|nr:hypothetical protein [Oryza sativa Japonica Group]BAD20162.1 hypothetical protein [Oryza sativa Japonica Group]